MFHLIAQTAPQTTRQTIEQVSSAPLSPRAALILFMLALVASWALFRLSRIGTLKRFRPYIVLGFIVLWGLVVIEVVFLIALTLTTAWLPLGLFILASVVLTNFQWLQNVMAGMSLSFEGDLSLGDTIRVDDMEGEIVELGLRSTKIHGMGGRSHDIPNRKLVDDAVSNLEAGGDSACDIDVTVPEHLSTERARKLALDAATLTPLASPRHQAEVYVKAEDSTENNVRLHIRGFAFDASEQDRYRSEVNSRLLEAFRHEA